MYTGQKLWLVIIVNKENFWELSLNNNLFKVCRDECAQKDRKVAHGNCHASDCDIQ